MYTDFKMLWTVMPDPVYALFFGTMGLLFLCCGLIFLGLAKSCRETVGFGMVLAFSVTVVSSAFGVRALLDEGRALVAIDHFSFAEKADASVDGNEVRLVWEEDGVVYTLVTYRRNVEAMADYLKHRAPERAAIVESWIR